jgi:hypothetical protein
VHRVADCVIDSVRLTVPQPTEWQRIGNQIDAAFIFARADFVKALEVLTDAGRTACYNALRLDGRFAKSLRETHGLLAWKS